MPRQKRSASKSASSGRTAPPPTSDLGAFDALPEEVLEMVAERLAVASDVSALARTCRVWARILRSPTLQAALKQRFATRVVQIWVMTGKITTVPVTVPALPNGALHGSFSHRTEGGTEFCGAWDTGKRVGRHVTMEKGQTGVMVRQECEYRDGQKHGTMHRYRHTDGKLCRSGGWVNGRRHGTHVSYIPFLLNDHFDHGKWRGCEEYDNYGRTLVKRRPEGRFVHVEEFDELGHTLLERRSLAKPRRNTTDAELLFGEYVHRKKDGSTLCRARFSDDGRLLSIKWTPKNGGFFSVTWDSETKKLTASRHGSAITMDDVTVRYRCDDDIVWFDAEGASISGRSMHKLFCDGDSDDDISDLTDDGGDDDDSSDLADD